MYILSCPFCLCLFYAERELVTLWNQSEYSILIDGINFHVELTQMDGGMLFQELGNAKLLI